MYIYYSFLSIIYNNIRSTCLNFVKSPNQIIITLIKSTKSTKKLHLNLTHHQNHGLDNWITHLLWSLKSIKQYY